jgi:hypothetical protein
MKVGVYSCFFELRSQKDPYFTENETNKQHVFLKMTLIRASSNNIPLPRTQHIPTIIIV